MLPRITFYFIIPLLFFGCILNLNAQKAPIMCDAGTFTVTIDGSVQANCTNYNLGPGQSFIIVSNGDAVLPTPASAGDPAGIAFVIFDCDPVAAGYDMNDPATYTNASPCYVGTDNDNDQNLDANDYNFCGSSNSLPPSANPAWIVPITYDVNYCVNDPAQSPNCIITDLDNDGCFAYGCPMSITYTSTSANYGCGDTFYDPGGATEDYCPNANESWLICPDIPGDPVTVTFTSFTLEGGSLDYDFMDIYDGNDNTAPYLGRFKGTNSPGTITSTAASGCLFIEFESDSGLQFAGWEATVNCTVVPPSGCSAGTFSVDIDATPQTACSTYNLAAGQMLNIQGDGNEVLPTPANGAYPSGIGFAFFNCDPIAAGYDLSDPNTYTGSTCFVAIDTDDDLNIDISESNCGGASASSTLLNNTVWVVPVTYDYNSCAIASPPPSCGYFIDNDSDACVGFGCAMQINYLPTPTTFNCGDVFTDSGGASDYCPNSNDAWLLCPTTPGDPITLNFSNFNTAVNDNLIIYDGDDNTATQVGSYNGTSIPPNITSTAASGCLYAEFTSDGNTEQAGWQAAITCANPPSGCADAGTFTITIDGVAQTPCSSYDIPSGSTYNIAGNGDHTFPPPATGIYPVGIGFAIFSCDPIAAGYDLNDPATYEGGGAPCFLDLDNDDDQGIDANETNCGGYSGTDFTWPSTVWVVPITLDANCLTGGFGCGWAVDDDNDGCVDHGCVTQINYLPIPTTYTCGDTFVDPGGASANYCKGENGNGDMLTFTWLICPQVVGDPVTLTFSSFDVENTSQPFGDHLIIYDGNNNSAPQIGDYFGSSIPGPITSTAASGCLYAEFTSDEFDHFAGWEATISCALMPCPQITESTINVPGCTVTNGLACDLFISEYVDGQEADLTNDEKCIEIFNGTGGPVNLTGYTLAFYSNGNSSPSFTPNDLANLCGAILANNDVCVLCSGLGEDPTIATVQDGTFLGNFSGNDAIVLENNGTIIDIFGQIGCNPGSQWVDGTFNTDEAILVRDPSIRCGVTSNPTEACSSASFPTLGTEWIEQADNMTFTTLGAHTTTYNNDTCVVCVDDNFSISITQASNMPVGQVIEWFYDNTSNYNPYNGEGTLLTTTNITSTTYNGGSTLIQPMAGTDFPAIGVYFITGIINTFPASCDNQLPAALTATFPVEIENCCTNNSGFITN